jgi:DNA modification methylase
MNNLKKIKFLSAVPDAPGNLSIKYADIETIPFLPDNIKAHDKEGIKESIRTYGFVEPIGINRRSGHDIFGNGRLECLLEMLRDNEPCPKGIVAKVLNSTDLIFSKENELRPHKWFAPVVDGLDFSPEEEETLAIKLNVTNQKGGIDNIKAYEVLMRLKQKSEDQFVLTGYTNEDLEHIQMLAKFHSQVAELKHEKDNPPEAESEVQDDSGVDENICIELNKKWKVNVGDIFQIGNHRLICGDSRNIETYAKLLMKSKVRLVFTSPPYDNQRNYELSEKLDWTGLMNDVSKCLNAVLEAPADILINLGPIYKDAEVNWYWNNWLDYCKNELKNPLFGFYVWDKLTGMPGNHNGRLAPSHEFFFHFSFGRQSANKWIEKTDGSILRGPKKTNFREKDGGFKGLSSPDKLDQPFKVPDSVVRLQKELARGIHTEGHPATFPVKLPAFFIKTYSLIGDVVLEPFCGSGTTMVAAEELDRFCYGIDESPNYCALILERMSREFTNLEIKKL